MIKIAYSGTHGCGKTTAVYNEAYRKKLEEKNKVINVLTEVARESPFPINKSTTIDSEKWIFFTQLKRELEEENNCDILICDRTILDVLAYCKVSGFDSLVSLLYPTACDHLKTYDKIYFLSLENNNYHFSDGIRDEDILYRKDIELVLLDLYEDASKQIPCWNKKFFIT